MHAKFYERKRATSYSDRPIIEGIFTLKQRARMSRKAVKMLFLSSDELDTLQDELKGLGCDVNESKTVNAIEIASNLIGVPIEIIEELYTDVDKVA